MLDVVCGREVFRSAVYDKEKLYNEGLRCRCDCQTIRNNKRDFGVLGFGVRGYYGNVIQNTFYKSIQYES